MDTVTIRNVSIKDAERILEIYAYYVKKKQPLPLNMRFQR